MTKIQKPVGSGFPTNTGGELHFFEFHSDGSIFPNFADVSTQRLEGKLAGNYALKFDAQSCQCGISDLNEITEQLFNLKVVEAYGSLPTLRTDKQEVANQKIAAATNKKKSYSEEFKLTVVRSRLAEAKIKSFTGGDKVTGRPLYGSWVEFVPVGKIVLTTNNRPEIRGSDDGIWRRIREVPFNRQFKEAEQDRELMTALRQELPGILNWAIEGCLLWQTEGLHAPASVAASISAYRSEMDTVAGFIEDECHQDPSHRSSLANLYEQYASWCRTQNKHPRTKVQFGNALKSQGYAQVRDSTGRYWQGLTTFVAT